jgi:serine protease
MTPDASARPTRRCARAVLALTAALALCAHAAPSGAAEFDPFRRAAPRAQFADGVIVKLRPERLATAQAAASGESAAALEAAGAQRMSALAARTGIAMRGSRTLGRDMHVLRLARAAGGVDLQMTLARLRSDTSVEYAEPDLRMQRHAAPNDPRFASQWFLQAPDAGANGTTTAAVNAASAWDTTTGSRGVVVAVLDTGVRFDHPDLARAEASGKLLPGYDFVGGESTTSFLTANDGDGWDADAQDPGDWVSSSDRQQALFVDCTVEDSSWHGTRVAGIVGALTNNGVGVASLGWSTWVLPVRVLGKCGGRVSDIVTGMRWAAGIAVAGVPANPYPARILNLSLGGEGACLQSYQDAIDEVAARGVLVVVSAGNDGTAVDQPANCRGVVAVTGVRHIGTKVGFANLGQDVTIAAPGGNCVNTTGPCLYSLDTTTDTGATRPIGPTYTDQTDFNVGTSFSAPIVAGIASLMYAVNGNLSPAQATSRLRAGARAFPVVATDAAGQPIAQCTAPTGTQQLECNCTTTTCGAGLADAPGALAQALRPIAAVSVPSNVSAGQNVALNAGASAAACGRTITDYAWSVVSGPGALAATSGATTSIPAPATGQTVVRLTVTDDQGRTDTADVTIEPALATTAAPASAGTAACPAAITVTPSGGGGGGGTPPPTTQPPASSGGGGGGAVDPATLALGALLALAGARRRRG